MDKYLGKKLEGRYEVMEIIGIGGMANVYKAYDVLENRVVAVKILQEEHMNNEDMRRRFKNESKAMAVLNHPNVMRVYDVSFSDRMQSIVMEYIDGITLKEYIEQQKVLRWKEAVHFTVQILRALQHAHDKGIVHRDIKPQNIMLLSDGTIKITDFGIARFARSETRTLTDKAIGSVHYISPEQAAGGAIDARTDLYPLRNAHRPGPVRGGHPGFGCAQADTEYSRPAPGAEPLDPRGPAGNHHACDGEGALQTVPERGADAPRHRRVQARSFDPFRIQIPRRQKPCRREPVFGCDPERA